MHYRKDESRALYHNNMWVLEGSLKQMKVTSGPGDPMKEGNLFDCMENDRGSKDGTVKQVNSMYGQERRATECNWSGEVEPVGMDKDEEDMEVDKNDIVRRKEWEGIDHKMEYWYCC